MLYILHKKRLAVPDYMMESCSLNSSKHTALDFSNMSLFVLHSVGKENMVVHIELRLQKYGIVYQLDLYLDLYHNHLPEKITATLSRAQVKLAASLKLVLS